MKLPYCLSSPEDGASATSRNSGQLLLTLTGLVYSFYQRLRQDDTSFDWKSEFAWRFHIPRLGV